MRRATRDLHFFVPRTDIRTTPRARHTTPPGFAIINYWGVFWIFIDRAFTVLLWVIITGFAGRRGRNACVKIPRPGVCDVSLLWWEATLCLQCHYYHVLVAEATTAVDEPGKTWQLLSNAWCYFCFLCSLLAAVSCITGGSSFWQHSRQLLLFISCCVCSSECTDWFQWLILVEGGTGNEHGVVVRWISACVWRLVSAFFFMVCGIFIRCAVFLWAPEHVCDHGLWIFDSVYVRIQSINQITCTDTFTQKSTYAQKTR